MNFSVLIITFRRSGSSYFIDLLSNYDSSYKCIREEISNDNYINTIEQNKENSIICKYVFSDEEKDFKILETFKQNGYKFIFLLRNQMDIFISCEIANKNSKYSHCNTRNEMIDLNLHELHENLSYQNYYKKKINEFDISYSVILYEDLIDMNDNDLLHSVNDVFSKIHHNTRLYFKGEKKSTFIKQNTNKSSLENIDKIHNKFHKENNPPLLFFGKKKEILHYYKDHVCIKSAENKTLSVNIVNDSYFLKMDNVNDLFYDSTKNYICMCDNKIILVLTYDLQNPYHLINDDSLFIHFDTYDLSYNLDLILDKYSNHILFLKSTESPVINLENSFIIHIDQKTERLKNIVSLNCTKNLYFVNAITYDDDDVKLFCNYLIYRNYFIKELFLKNLFNSFTKGSICLALNNLSILRYCLKNNITEFLIFEDDLVANKNLNDMQLFLDKKPPNSDLLFFNVKQDFRDPLNYYNDYYYCRNKYSWSTLSYAVFSIKAIKTLIYHYSLFITCIDCYEFKDLYCYCSKKNFFIEDETYESSIRFKTNNVMETNNVWKYDYTQYKLQYEQKNFSIFNYSPSKSTWGKFVENLHNSSNQDKIGYDTDIEKNTLVFFDFIDREFGWDYYKFEKKYPEGVTFKWGGIIHHPLKLERYWGNNLAVSEYLTIPYVKKCLKTCKFMIVLSDSLKNEIIESNILDGFDIPIYVIYHIAPLPLTKNITYENTFENTYENTYENKKFFTFLGWSFRNFNLFCKIKIDHLKKIILPGTTSDEQNSRLDNILKIQTNNKHKNIQFLHHLSLVEFVKILHQSIPFLDFDGVSANNAIVECITYNIPVICRKTTATIFYLGEDYPMFFENEETIQILLSKLEFYVNKTITYFKKMNKTKLSLTTNVISVLSIIDSHQ